MSVTRRGGLGRGLAALIPPGEAGDGARATLAEVPVDAVGPNPRQPREVFDQEELDGLAVSIRDVGVLQPIVVRPVGGGRFELIAGERRLRAARSAGLDTIPTVIRHTDDADLLKEALVENIHRVQLTPLEEAAAYQQLLDDFGFTQEELARRLGRSRPAITNAIRLLGLPPGVQRRVAAGVLSAGHAKALLAVPDPSVQERLAARIVQEGMSVRATEELVRLRLLDGEQGGPAPSRPRPKVVVPELVDLQDDLSDALMARVRITMGARKGRLQVEFASVEDLERIIGIITKGLEDHPAGPAPAPGLAPDLGPASSRGQEGADARPDDLDDLDRELARLQAVEMPVDPVDPVDPDTIGDLGQLEDLGHLDDLGLLDDPGHLDDLAGPQDHGHPDTDGGGPREPPADSER